MVKSTNPPLFKQRDIIYAKGSYRGWSVEQTPDQLIEDDVPLYALRNLDHPHIKAKYPQFVIEREWSKKTPLCQTSSPAIAMNKDNDVGFSGPFLGREVITHKQNERAYLVLQTPVTCVVNDIASYQLKQLGLGPDTPPFFRSSIDVEMHWKPLDAARSANWEYVKIADVIDLLIRGDMLETRLFPEIGPYYHLGQETQEGQVVYLFRRINNGIAENEVRRFTREDLLKNFRVHTLQVMSIEPTAPKYNASDAIKHLKSGEVYTIALLPNRVVIEATREPAYGFIMPDGRICIRSQKEVEDPKRFVPHILPCDAIQH